MLRTCGDMEWTLKNLPGSDDLMTRGPGDPFNPQVRLHAFVRLKAD